MTSDVLRDRIIGVLGKVGEDFSFEDAVAELKSFTRILSPKIGEEQMRHARIRRELREDGIITGFDMVWEHPAIVAARDAISATLFFTLFEANNDLDARSSKFVFVVGACDHYMVYHIN